MRDLMVDLETLSTRSDAAVVSVGLAMFGPEGLGRSFYGVVSPDSVVGHIDVPTIAWWFEQADEVRLLFNDHINQAPLHHILDIVAEFSAAAEPGLRVWGHGASFDIPILENQFKSIGHEVPWDHRAPRDTRTLFEMAGVSVETPPGVKHNALADAQAQAGTVIRASKIVGQHLVWPELKV